VSKLASPAEFPLGAFTPPSGISSQAGCMNPLLPRMVNKVAPKYPQTPDSNTAKERSLKGAGSDFDDSTKSAISHWRYDPAMCGGQPVDVGTVLQVNYALSGH